MSDDYGFKFKVGDFAHHVSAQFPDRREQYSKTPAAIVHIVERTLQQCPGGIQRHYIGRICIEGGHFVQMDGERYQTFNEIELIAYVPPVEAPAAETA